MTWKSDKEGIPRAKNPNQCAHFFLSTNGSSFVQCCLVFFITDIILFPQKGKS